MQRLTRSGRGGRRPAGERGATAVLFALLLVPMLGFAGIAVDVGALYAERARLQVGADAAAIAVAQDCSRGNCGDMMATAQGLITANDTEGTAAEPILRSDPLSVTVTGATPKEHWFAPLIGHEATAVSATATVGWGSPSGGTAVLPLTFSWCSFKAQTGGGLPSTTTLQTIKLSKSAEDLCTGPSGNVVPGGFGFVETGGAACEATSGLDQKLSSSTGNNPPAGCDEGDFAAFVGQTVLLPIFDAFGGTGSHAWYQVYGYAAFKISGYDFGGKYNTDKKACGGNGSVRCVIGHFTRFVELSDAWNYSPDAPQMGSAILRLIR
jgi:Flp pilus assembly protein TadG